MAVLLGTRASIEFELNLLLQIVILIMAVVGYWFARNKTQNSLRTHERIMMTVVSLNGISLIFIMGPAFITYSGAVLSEVFAIGFPLTLLHHCFGLVAEVLGLILVFKKFGNVRTVMRLTLLFWLLALTLGISFFIKYYLV